MPKITVIYPVHDRIDYVKITLPRVIDEVKRSDNDVRLHILMDRCDFNTMTYCRSVWRDCIEIDEGNTAMLWNHGIDLCAGDGSRWIVKIDNDILIPEGYIDALAGLMSGSNDAGFIGFRECGGLPVCSDKLTLSPARWIGGVGIVDPIVFTLGIDLCPSGTYFGFTAFQTKVIQRGYKAYWVDGGSNTNLDMSCWGRQQEYAARGLCRIGLVSDERNVHGSRQGNG